MKLFYALEPRVLEKFWAFRDAENRVRNDLSSERIAEIREAVNPDAGPLYEVKDGIANIRIEGILSPRRTLSAALFGEVETVYTDIGEGTLQAEDDPAVREIHYHVDSPGGRWEGLDLCAQIIALAAKPTVAIVYSLAASAAYYLASQADGIHAVSRGSMVGSIGVATEIFDHAIENENRGVRRIVITNTDSKDKRPDATTDEGYAVVQDELNDIYAIFEERIIEGRTRRVADFGVSNIRNLRGRVVTARKALRAGLIDDVSDGRRGGSVHETDVVDDGNSDLRREQMDLQELLRTNPQAQAEHDELMNQSIAQSRTEGESGERERVSGLLALAGISLSAELKAAINEGQDEGAYAVAVLQAGAAPPKANADIIGGTTAAPEPRETAPNDTRIEALAERLARGMRRKQ